MDDVSGVGGGRLTRNQSTRDEPRGAGSVSPRCNRAILIDQLNTSSERFRALWAEYDVKGHASGLLLLNHPIAGPLDLYFLHLTLRGTQNTMVVYWAQPGTPSVDGLNRLRDLA
ncbi:MmyB family transcriptional regulator [Mycolicibacterium confluentis]|uniref:Uncharacterized protein n=1 Tax=Mycolicibacterium confluentis TaxID=28047 RepID=A0A7I7XSF3_9MYCO|nr:hypothetical protein [Mycolicibacterium confluentis]ORV33033.1 hypothetical protein AWB99_08405 [Mycolicibacterium confluentis]BBZ32084.1 hypothetical protein MCNF_06890 [Mycolicibacterium confluentis]